MLIGKLKTSQDKREMLKGRVMETNASDCSLYSIKPPAVPKVIAHNAAIIPNANLGESSNDKKF